MPVLSGNVASTRLAAVGMREPQVTGAGAGGAVPPGLGVAAAGLNGAVGLAVAG
jgi:hypothetical protein